MSWIMGRDDGAEQVRYTDFSSNPQDFPAHELSRPLVERFRSYSRTRRFSSTRTSGSCNFAVLSTCCDAIRVDLPPPPVLRCASNPRRIASALITLPLYSYSFRIRRAKTVAFASPSFLPTRRSSCISRVSELVSSLPIRRPSSCVFHLWRCPRLAAVSFLCPPASAPV
jgi:hypothetical protein